MEVGEAVSMSPSPRPPSPKLRKPLHVAGLILARGGSEGIPLKNLAPLGGQPLLEWALGAMLNFGGFDSLWVSTDHAAIATCATSLGSLVFARSPRFATATSPSIEAVNEFLHSHPEVDVVALVQCTSPFLRPGSTPTHFLKANKNKKAVVLIVFPPKFQTDQSALEFLFMF